MKRKRFLAWLLSAALISSLLPCMAVQAETTIKLGDYVQMGTYYDEPILWRCVSFEKIKGYDDDGNPIMDATDTVTEYKNGYLPLMISNKILCLKAFDASGENWNSSHGRGWSNSPYYQHSWRGLNGSNYWNDSNIRDWLNSMASKGKVKWSCGNPPSEEFLNWGLAYSNENGFLTNFTNNEYTAIKHVTQKYILDPCDLEFATEGNHNYTDMSTYSDAYSQYIDDVCFLLDIQQVDNISKNMSFFDDNIVYATPTKQCILKYADSEQYQAVLHNCGNSYMLSDDEEYPYWLRSSSDKGKSGQYTVAIDKKNINDSDGFIRMTEYCSNSGYIGIRPAFFLSETASFISGNGTETSPYTVDSSGSYTPAVETLPPTPTPQPTSLKISCNEPSLSTVEGNVFMVGAGVQDDSGNYNSPEDITVDISDESILKPIKTAEYMGEQRYFTLQALKEGTAVIKITDKATGQTGELPFTVNKKNGVSYTIYDIPNLGDDKNPNFNNFSGLYVDSFKVNKQLDGSAVVSFDVYNQNYTNAVVEVYNADGKMTDAEIIDKCEYETSIKDISDTMFDIGKDIWSGVYNPLSYKSSIQTKHTPIKNLTIPCGGYLKITPDTRESAVCGSANALDIISQVMSLSGDIMDISSMKKKKGDIAKTVTEKIKEGGSKLIETYGEKMTNEISNKTITSRSNATELISAINDMFSSGELRELAVSAFTDSAIDLSVSAAEDWFTKGSGIAGAAISGFFKASEASNLYMQTRFFGLKANKGGIIIQVPDGSIRRCSDVTVKCKMSDKTSLNVYKLDKNGAELAQAKKAHMGVFGSSIEGYDITLSQNGAEVQPEGKAEVSISIPSYMQNSKNIAVYRLEKDGDITDMKGKVSQNKITFETDHFSTYILTADDTEKDTEKEAPETEDGKTVINGGTIVSTWAAEEVQEAFDENLVPDVLHGADLTKKVDRAEFAAIAVKLYENLSENNAKAGENPFIDISGNACENEILKAYNLGITNGITDVTFEPSTNISREQVATMLTRAYKKSEFPGWALAKDSDYPLNFMGVTKYADDGEISDYAKESVYFMTRWEILKGVDDTHFAPKNNTTLGESYGYATREQAVVIALRSAKHL